MPDQFIHCNYCETELPSSALFCSGCGQPLGALRCETCQSENVLGALFCQDCGSPLDADESTPADDLRSDLKAAATQLDLAEEQNALNERELELYTAEKRAEKQSQVQQKIDAAELEGNAEQTLAQAERDRQHQADLAATDRKNEQWEQQDGIRRQHEDEAAGRQHQRKLEKWERKKAELEKEMVLKREWLNNQQELNAIQRDDKRRQLEEDHRQQLEYARRQLGVDIDLAQLETDARIAREKAENEHALGVKQAESQFGRTERNLDRQDELAHRKNESELEQQQEDRELDRSLAAYERLQVAKEKKRDARTDRELRQKQGEQEVETTAERARREMELERLSALNTLSPEALIAASPETQAQLLAELRQTETFQGMSEDQILARAAEKSPAVAQALAEKYKAAGSEKSKQELVDLYAQMFSAQQSQAASNLEAMQNLVAVSLQTQPRPATPPAAAPAPIPAPPAVSVKPQPPTGLDCSQCGAARSSGAKFCTKCGASNR